LFILIAPTTLIRSIAYPHSAAQAPLRLLNLNSGEKDEREYTRLDSYDSAANIGIPVLASSLEPQTTISVDGWRVTLTGDNGWRWQSKWINKAFKLSYDNAAGRIDFTLPANLADQLAQVHANATIDLAFAVYRLGPAERVETGADRFTVPGVGFCHWIEGDGGLYFRKSPLVCVAPLRLPGVKVARIESGDDTCRPDKLEPPLTSGHYASITDYGTDDVPAEFDPNPVRDFDFAMGAWIPGIPSVRNPKQIRVAVLCRGTPFTVRTGSLVGRTRATFDLGSIGSEKLISNERYQIESFDPAEE
jgi:hypothetical protein